MKGLVSFLTVFRLAALLAPVLCLAVAPLILLGAGCATDDSGSSRPWSGAKGWESSDGGEPFPWETPGR